jgi:predicted transcriptional regulator
MLESLFGNATVEKILFSLKRSGKGYASGLSATFGISVSTVQQQLRRLERGGILASRLEGKTRLYEPNPLYPFREELDAFLKKAFAALPDRQVQKYYSPRARPRRAGKP